MKASTEGLGFYSDAMSIENPTQIVWIPGGRRAMAEWCATNLARRNELRDIHAALRATTSAEECA